MESETTETRAFPYRMTPEVARKAARARWDATTPEERSLEASLRASRVWAAKRGGKPKPKSRRVTLAALVEAAEAVALLESAFVDPTHGEVYADPAGAIAALKAAIADYRASA